MLELDINRFPNGSVTAPPSKSIAHRALIGAALSEGESFISNIEDSDDIVATSTCLSNLCAVLEKAEHGIKVTGMQKSVFKPYFDCIESGTTLRFLIPLIKALTDEDVFISGKPSLMKRPQEVLLKALHGVSYREEGGGLWLSGKLEPGEYQIRGDISSQYISGLLIALSIVGNSELNLTSELQSSDYVNLTLDMMAKFGVQIEHEEYEHFSFAGPAVYSSADVTVEGDYSQAAFFLVASALGSSVRVKGLREDSLQGDKQIIPILEKSGVVFTRSRDEICANGGTLKAQTVDVSGIPDLVPPLAVFFSFAEGESRLVNASRLRYKESDRLESVCHTLSKLGADIRIENDSLVLSGKDALKGDATIDPANDHRIAMAAAVASIRSIGEVKLLNPGVVRKSYPSFWEDFMVSEVKPK
jgi:3-phosphoshikimate 1-carboxyvinyltransferase